MNRNISCNYKIFNSKFGNIIILWKYKNDIPKIVKIILADKNYELIQSAISNLKKSSCSIIDETVKNILMYFSGKIINFNLDIIDFDICTDFQKKVFLNLLNVPRGYIITYKNLANKINMTQGSRAVGNVLASNPFPIIIPCHRVVQTNGLLGGYQGGIKMKYQLLEMEGIKIIKKGNAKPQVLPQPRR